MVEYRPVGDDEVEAFREVLDYAFRPEAGPGFERDEDDEPTPVGDRRGLYDDGTVVTTAVHLPFTASVRGRWLDATGLTGVATRPAHRRRGLVRRLLRESLAEHREQGRPFSLLWPFKHGFYARYGWGRLGDLGRYELGPAALSPVADHPLIGGRIGPLSVDDIPDLQALDGTRASRNDLAIRRSEAWYRHRFFEGWRTDPYVYGWYRDGSLAGYLRYGFAEDGDDRRLDVYEFGAPDVEAAVNLLAYLLGHQDQVGELRVYADVDDLLFDLADDAGSVDLTVLPGSMGRLVDVTAGLEALPVPPDLEGAISLSVSDPLVDWNEGPFRVAARDGDFVVEADQDAAADAHVPIATLSRLAFGTTTAERAAGLGDIEADPAAVEFLDAAFPPRHACLRVFF